MNCPCCHKTAIEQKKFTTKDGTYREYLCPRCGETFFTEERPAPDAQRFVAFAYGEAGEL